MDRSRNKRKRIQISINNRNQICPTPLYRRKRFVTQIFSPLSQFSASLRQDETTNYEDDYLELYFPRPQYYMNLEYEDPWCPGLAEIKYTGSQPVSFMLLSERQTNASYLLAKRISIEYGSVLIDPTVVVEKEMDRLELVCGGHGEGEKCRRFLEVESARMWNTILNILRKDEVIRKGYVLHAFPFGPDFSQRKLLEQFKLIMNINPPTIIINITVEDREFRTEAETEEEEKLLEDLKVELETVQVYREPYEISYYNIGEGQSFPGRSDYFFGESYKDWWLNYKMSRGEDYSERNYFSELLFMSSDRNECSGERSGTLVTMSLSDVGIAKEIRCDCGNDLTDDCQCWKKLDPDAVALTEFEKYGTDLERSKHLLELPYTAEHILPKDFETINYVQPYSSQALGITTGGGEYWALVENNYGDINIEDAQETLDIIIKHADPQSTIVLDGNLPFNKMFDILVERLKCLGVTMKSKAERVFKEDGAGLDPSSEPIPEYGGERGEWENDKPYLEPQLTHQELLDLSTGHPWGQRCPVAYRYGEYTKGSPTWAVCYRGKYYLLSSKQCAELFCKTPSKYLLPAMPIAAAKVFVVGSDESQTSFVMDSIAMFFGAKAISYSEVYDLGLRYKWDDVKSNRQNEIIKKTLKNLEAASRKQHKYKERKKLIKTYKWLLNIMSIIYARVNEFSHDPEETGEDSKRNTPRGRDFDAVSFLEDTCAVNPDFYMAKYCTMLSSIKDQFELDGPRLRSRSRMEDFSTEYIETYHSLQNEFLAYGLPFFQDITSCSYYYGNIELIQYLPRRLWPKRPPKPPGRGSLEFQIEYNKTMNLVHRYLRLKPMEIATMFATLFRAIEKPYRGRSLRYGGWVVGGIPLTKELWTAFEEKACLPYDVIQLHSRDEMDLEEEQASDEDLDLEEEEEEEEEMMKKMSFADTIPREVLKEKLLSCYVLELSEPKNESELNNIPDFTDNFKQLIQDRYKLERETLVERESSSSSGESTCGSVSSATTGLSEGSTGLDDTKRYCEPEKKKLTKCRRLPFLKPLCDTLREWKKRCPLCYHIMGGTSYYNKMRGSHRGYPQDDKVGPRPSLCIDCALEREARTEYRPTISRNNLEPRGAIHNTIPQQQQTIQREDLNTPDTEEKEIQNVNPQIYLENSDETLIYTREKDKLRKCSEIEDFEDFIENRIFDDEDEESDKCGSEDQECQDSCTDFEELEGCPRGYTYPDSLSSDGYSSVGTVESPGSFSSWQDLMTSYPPAEEQEEEQEEEDERIDIPVFQIVLEMTDDIFKVPETSFGGGGGDYALMRSSDDEDDLPTDDSLSDFDDCYWSLFDELETLGLMYASRYSRVFASSTTSKYKLIVESLNRTEGGYGSIVNLPSINVAPDPESFGSEQEPALAFPLKNAKFLCPVQLREGKSRLGETDRRYSFMDEEYYFCSHKCQQIFRMHPEKYSTYRTPIKKLPGLKICVVSPLGTNSEQLARKISELLELQYYDFDQIIEEQLLPPGCLPLGMVNEDNTPEYDYCPPGLSPDEVTIRCCLLRSYIGCESGLPDELMETMLKPFRLAKTNGMVYHRFPHSEADFDFMIDKDFYPDAIVFVKADIKSLVENVTPVVVKRWEIKLAAIARRRFNQDVLNRMMWKDRCQMQFKKTINRMLTYHEIFQCYLERDKKLEDELAQGIRLPFTLTNLPEDYRLDEDDVSVDYLALFEEYQKQDESGEHPSGVSLEQVASQLSLELDKYYRMGGEGEWEDAETETNSDFTREYSDTTIVSRVASSTETVHQLMDFMARRSEPQVRADEHSAKVRNLIFQYNLGGGYFFTELFEKAVRHVREKHPRPRYLGRNVDPPRVRKRSVKAALSQGYARETAQLQIVQKRALESRVPTLEYEIDTMEEEQLIEILKSMKRNPVDFDNAYEIEAREAEEMITKGELYLSRFGRRCPVEMFEATNPTHQLIDYKKLFGVVHRKYVYFLGSSKAKTKFLEDPYKYENQPGMAPLIPLKIIILGPPLTGKTNLAERLCDKFGLTLITLESAVQYQVKCLPWTRLAKDIVKAISLFLQVPSHLSARAIRAATLTQMASTYGWVLTDVPMNAEFLAELKNCNVTPNITFYIDSCTDEAKKCNCSPDCECPRMGEDHVLDECRHFGFKNVDRLKDEGVCSETEDRFRQTSSHYRKVILEEWYRANNLDTALEWLEAAWNNVHTINGGYELQHMFEQMERVFLETYRALQYYYKTTNRTDVAVPVCGLNMTWTSYLSRSSNFQDHCPVCQLLLNYKVKSPDPVTEQSNILQIDDQYYWVCDQHVSEFVMTTRRYVKPKSWRIEATKPCSRGNQREDIDDFRPEMSGLCPVCFWGNKSYGNRIVAGRLEFNAEFRGKCYLSCSRECYTTFKLRPEAYVHKYCNCMIQFWKERLAATLPPPSTDEIQQLEYICGLSRDGELWSLVEKGLKQLALSRPNLPGMSTYNSALIYLSYYLQVLKAENDDVEDKEAVIGLKYLTDLSEVNKRLIHEVHTVTPQLIYQLMNVIRLRQETMRKEGKFRTKEQREQDKATRKMMRDRPKRNTRVLNQKKKNGNNPISNQ